MTSSGSTPGSRGVSVALAAVATLLGALLIGAGAALPWVRIVTDYGSTTTYGGLQDGRDGGIMLGFAVVVFLVALARLAMPQRAAIRVVVIVLAVLVAAMALFELGSIYQKIQALYWVSTPIAFNSVHVGEGPLIGLVGALLALVGGLLPGRYTSMP